MDEFVEKVKKHLTWASQMHMAKKPTFEVQNENLVVNVFDSSKELGHIDVPMKVFEFSLKDLKSQSGLDKAFNLVSSMAFESTRAWY
ncbi:hypothetical protein NQ023_00245 [Corynebacterium phoceense]|uniref:hypothetical protein n=1 Tax=Corynebacterium phoceense TaxID=1686286 RepID=UPI00211CC1A2|nr:hypothetical protein [Corynebacterium phoceense]MCQ9330505.1 hypothetical protein [Corynebacterium phoceense]MCQ9346901.1 hypothetical protein [Corynebacterium phoceense]